MKTVFEILLDVSGSMGMKGGKKHLLPDGSTRISLAKSILCNEIIPAIDYASNIFIRLFSAPENNIPAVININNGQSDLSDVIKKIDLIDDSTPNGGTPISEALKISIDNVSNNTFDDFEKVIILISDGEESPGGNYKKVIEKAIQEGIQFKLHIIGLGLDTKSCNIAKEVSNITKGTFHQIDTINYEKHDLKKAILPINVSVISESLNAIKKMENEAKDGILDQQLILETKLIKMQFESQQETFSKSILTLQNCLNEIKIEKQNNTKLLIENIDNLKIKEDIIILERIFKKNIEDLKKEILTVNESVLKFQNSNSQKFDSSLKKSVNFLEDKIDLITQKQDDSIQIINAGIDLKFKESNNKTLLWIIITLQIIIVILLTFFFLYFFKKNIIDLKSFIF